MTEITPCPSAALPFEFENVAFERVHTRELFRRHGILAGPEHASAMKYVEVAVRKDKTDYHVYGSAQCAFRGRLGLGHTDVTDGKATDNISTECVKQMLVPTQALPAMKTLCSGLSQL